MHGQTVLPENRVGAGGAIALQALAQQAGNGHWLGTFHTGAIAGAVTGLIKADVRQFPPVAMMVEETSVVAVRADSPLRSATDLVAALKANPASLRIAVAPALGQNTHLAIGKPLKTAGVAVDKLTIAPFRSSGESVQALIGGHVQLADRVTLGGNATIHQFVRVGRGAMFTGSIGTSLDLPPWFTLTARNVAGSMNVVGLRRSGASPEEIHTVRWVYRQLYRSGCTPQQSLGRLRTRAGDPVVDQYIAFIEQSKRGICHGQPRPARAAPDATE